MLIPARPRKRNQETAKEDGEDGLPVSAWLTYLIERREIQLLDHFTRIRTKRLAPGNGDDPSNASHSTES